MVRIAEIKDMRNVYKLICELEQQRLPYAQFISIYKDQLENPWYFCFVAEINREIVGILNLRIENQLRHVQKVAEITEFVVKDGFRSLGIGKRLFKMAFELAKENYCVQLESSCHKNWNDVHHFYDKAGMEETSYKFIKSISYTALNL